MGKGGEVPKFVIALKYLLHILGILTAITALPTQLYFLFVVKFFGRASLWESDIAYFILFFFRWLFCTLAFPFAIAQPSLLGYYLFTLFGNVGIAVGVAIGFAVSIILGMFYIVFGWFSEKDSIQINWTSEGNNNGYWRSLLDGWLDFGTFISVLLCIATVIRIPFLIVNQKKTRSAYLLNAVCRVYWPLILDL